MLSGVSRTAILTLRARVDEHARPDRVFEDPVAADWWSRIPWPAELDAWYADQSQVSLAFRADDIDRIVARFVSHCPGINVTELGAGLSTRRHRLRDLEVGAWLDLDLPEVAALRRQWDPGARTLGRSVLDFGWMDALEGAPDQQLFIAEGLLYYLPRPEVAALIAELGRRFDGSVLVMDVLGANDYPTLRQRTEALATPVLWRLEGPYAQALEELGLAQVPEFEPTRLTEEALARYWPRFDAKMRGAIFCARQFPAYWERRSGVVLGRLIPGPGR